MSQGAGAGQPGRRSDGPDGPTAARASSAATGASGATATTWPAGRPPTVQRPTSERDGRRPGWRGQGDGDRSAAPRGQRDFSGGQGRRDDRGGNDWWPRTGGRSSAGSYRPGGPQRPYGAGQAGPGATTGTATAGTATTPAATRAVTVTTARSAATAGTATAVPLAAGARTAMTGRDMRPPRAAPSATTGSAATTGRPVTSGRAARSDRSGRGPRGAAAGRRPPDALADHPGVSEILPGAVPQVSGEAEDSSDISGISSQVGGLRVGVVFPPRERRPVPPDAVHWP